MNVRAQEGEPRRSNSRPSRWVNYLLLVLVALFLAAFAVHVLMPASEETYENGEISRVFLLRAWVVSAIQWGPLVLGAALIGCAILGFIRRRIALPIVAVVVPFLLVPVALVWRLMAWGGDWTAHDRLTGPDEATYVFLDTSFLQGQVMALGRERPAGLVRRTFDVVGSNNGDWPRSWAPVVRPADRAHEAYGQLYLSEAGMVVGIRHGYCCFLAYDTRTARFYGHGDVEDLSPFVLIGPGTTMHQADVSAILSGANPCGGPASGRPKPETLEEALNHPNAEVRQAARKMLDALPPAADQP